MKDLELMIVPDPDTDPAGHWRMRALRAEAHASQLQSEKDHAEAAAEQRAVVDDWHRNELAVEQASRW